MLALWVSRANSCGVLTAGHALLALTFLDFLQGHEMTPPTPGSECACEDAASSTAAAHHPEGRPPDGGGQGRRPKTAPGLAQGAHVGQEEEGQPIRAVCRDGSQTVPELEVEDLL